MPKISLLAAFSLEPHSAISAQQVFTNRVSEVGAFDEAVQSLAATLAAPGVSPVTDRSVPRKNVLVYYGVGGIGKTTLSEELERRFIKPPQASAATPDRASIRFDFAESATFDMEAYVLRLRAGLGHLAKSWHAFDVAFAVYWERAHPGESLDEFITKDSALRRVSRTVGLTEQIDRTLTDAFGAALPGVARAAHVLGGLAYTKAKQAIVSHRVLKDCDLLSDLIDADADIETLSYFPYLLAWDLARLPAPHPKAIVLLDTFEEVTSRATRETERWIQRSAYLMPNMLFVVTGRNRLDWADLGQATELDFTGSHRWPLLHAGQTQEEPRQHLVGYMSASDADAYLVSALTQANDPVIPAPIRQRIVTASGGLPLYLDLAVTTRDLLRAAALLTSFDTGILHAGCPHVPDSALSRFTARSFLEMNPDRTFPYALHSTLRDAIRAADVDLRDSWSPRERAEVAARMGTYLHQAAATAAQSGDRTGQVAAVAEAIDLCELTGQFFDWLPASAQQLLTCGGWGLLPELSSEGDGAIRALILGLQGARERRSGQLADSISLLDTALAQPGLPASLQRFLLLHRAHALRVAGRYAAAADDYRQLWQEPGDFRDDAGYWLADYSFLDGRFSEAVASLDELTDLTPELRGEVLRLRGHVFRVNGLFDQAEARYREALVRNQVEVVKIRAASAVALTMSGNYDAASTQIQEGSDLARQCGYKGGLVWCQVAQALSQLARDDVDGARVTARTLAGTVGDLQGNRFWSEIVNWWIDPAANGPGSATTDWLDGVEAAKARWLTVRPSGAGAAQEAG